MPQQNSITSSPRVTSPIASDSTLPCSAVRYFAISSRRSCTSSRIANRISARFAIESARHAGNAAFAAWTARSTSSTVAKSTAPDCCARRRVEHGAAAARRAGVRRAGDPVVDRLDGCGCVEDVGHGVPSLESSTGRLAPWNRRSQSSPRTPPRTCCRGPASRRSTATSSSSRPARHRASMQRLRLGDVEAAVAWARDAVRTPRDHAVSSGGSAGARRRRISQTGSPVSASSRTTRRRR